MFWGVDIGKVLSAALLASHSVPHHRSMSFLSSNRPSSIALSMSESIEAKVEPTTSNKTNPLLNNEDEKKPMTRVAKLSYELKDLPMESPMDLANNFRKIYFDLERPAAIHKNITSTVRFDYVTPPVETLNNKTVKVVPTWNNPAIQGLDWDTLPQELLPDATKPLAVYLPGLDGYGISACGNQFDELASKFEFWRLFIDGSDRSSFAEIVSSIVDFLEQISKEEERPVTLIGESCGGLLASAVAIRLQKIKPEVLKGLVLVNPATSFDQTAWDTLVPVLTSLGSISFSQQADEDDSSLTAYGVLGSLILSTLVPDNDQLGRILNTILDLPSLQRQSLTDPNALSEILKAAVKTFRGTEERLPPELLQHRVKNWLGVGTSVVNERIAEIKTPILLVVGQDDRVMPSRQEPDRLKQAGVRNLETLSVPGRGHIVLDENVNLTEAILYSKIDPYGWKETKKPYDSITDWKLPSDVYTYIDETVQRFRDAFSPVFISTDFQGKRWMGLGKIPRSENPILIVGNHQLLALDMQLYLSELLEQRNIFARGLAHPVTFATNMQFDTEMRGQTPGLIPRNDDGKGRQRNPGNPVNSFEEFGAVVVTPRNYYRLLQTGQNVLLFPGGAKEALSGNRSYPLYWPEKVDFVRTAARFNATIIPLSAVGMAESFNVLLEPKDVLNLPIVGEWAREVNKNQTSARYDQKPGDEVVGFPLALPGLPQRNYFLFGKPIDTSGIDPKDKESCARIYAESQEAVRRGIDDLMKARENDPFKDTPRRFAYERVFRKKAPTFPIDQLN